MDGERRLEEVNPELATALGLYAMSDARIHEAAAEAGVTRWELERAIDDAGLSEAFGLDQSRDVSDTLDDILDGA
jgi:hypothetical protein